MTVSANFPNITNQRVATNGIELNIAEQGEGPLVLMCHGFPESWYSWRHQIDALAGAGFHVIAPDMRGYGDTDAPPDVRAYDIVHLAGDMAGIVDEAGADQAVIVGHDWGSVVAWHTALRHPDRFRA